MLKDFRERLQNLMHDDHMRPFTCSGNPYDCRIFIVGANPATVLKPFFDTYWSDITGFLRDKFDDDYLAKKKKRGIRPNIEEFVHGASPIPCLETNVYATPSKHTKDLPDDKKNISIFEFLLREIQPDAIFLFAKDSIKDFEFRFNCKLYGDRFLTVEVFGHKTHVLRLCPDKNGHYDVFWRVGREKVRAIGEEFKTHLTK